jgi:isocitrate dehydrogenase (NAD+)
MTLSAEMLLRHVGQTDAAARMRAAVETVLSKGSCLTKDLGGDATTTQITKAIISAIQ